MLQVQVHIRIPKPGSGISYSKSLMDEIAKRWLSGAALPKGISVTAISWNGGRPVTGRRMEDARFRFSAIGEDFNYEGMEALG